ncbi:MAG: 30S ribosomal protein S14 [Simkaniaceae bacterium]|nr:30S ribosomal protein S14 [Simkaniaceae bacterium]MCF7851671.1 30S ribosomal protein S14 [Simkaniaceae bacterium]
MARSSQFEKEKKRQKLINSYYEKRQALKKIISSPYSTEEEKKEAMIKLNKLPRNSSPIRARNRCSMTGRPRGYLRKFKISRLCFREFANSGLIPGMYKASW